MKDELGEQIIKEFVVFSEKVHSLLKENNDEDNKAKVTRSSTINRKPKFQDYKNCLNEAKIDGKIKSLQKNTFNADNIKELIKNNLILETQQKFTSERPNIFTEVINKIFLSSNDDRKLQSVDLTEIYSMERPQI